MLLDTLHSETQICGSRGLISPHWYAVSRKEMPQLSSTKLESLPPMLSQQLRKSPTPFLSSVFTFKPAPTHIQGILLKLKNKKQHSMQMQPQYWIWTHSHIPCRAQEEHICTKAGFLSVCFSIFSIFSLLNMLLVL